MIPLFTVDAIRAHEGLVLFSAPWCGPCGPCGPYKPALMQFCTLHRIELGYVDIDAHRELAAEFSVRAVPTTVLVRGGEVVKRVTGAQTALALQRLIA
jgi:thioredoxin-like negative regulator of GroEL